MLLIIVLYATLALTFVVAKNAIAYASPFFLIGCRMTLAGAVLLSYQYLYGTTQIQLHRSDRWLFFKAALFHIYLSFVLEFWALQYLSSAKTNLMYSATPFISALLSYFLLNEPLGWHKFAGIGLGFFGLLPLLLSTAGEEITAPWYPPCYLPEIVLGCAITFSAYAWFIVKQLMDKGYALPIINGIAMLIGGAGAFATSFFIEGIGTTHVYQWKPFLGWLSLLILTANIIVYNLYGWLIRKYSITFVSFAGFLCPLFGSFFGWLLRGEPITQAHYIALCTLPVALYIFHGIELKKNS